MNNANKILPAMLLCLVITACDGEAPSDAAVTAPQSVVTPAVTAAPDPVVVETFNIGDTAYVRSLAVEVGSNTLWVGSSLGVLEVDLASQQVKNTFTRDDGLANEYVFAIGIDPEGYKWFGTNAGGMSRYRDGQWKTYFPMHGLADYWVYSFANHPDGSLWIGTWAGVNRLDRTTGKLTTYVQELINEWVYGIAVDQQGAVWFGTEGGISRFNGESWDSWDHADGIGAKNSNALSASINTGLGTRSRHDLGVLAGGRPTYNPSYVFSIIVAADNTVWAGTWGGGVSHRKDGQWHNYTTEDGLAGNIVYSILQDSKGALWFGTDNGLSRFDGVHWVNVRVDNGLKNKDVYAIVEDTQGDIWVGTRGGVTHIAAQY